jgi:hypothetical protein
MVLGALALLLFSFIVCQMLMRFRISAGGSNGISARYLDARSVWSKTDHHRIESMIVGAKLSALKEGRWYEHGMRFGLGGFTTLIAGLVGDYWGPAVGGLFLAFPAVLCASATLVETHETSGEVRAWRDAPSTRNRCRGAGCRRGRARMPGAREFRAGGVASYTELRNLVTWCRVDPLACSVCDMLAHAPWYGRPHLYATLKAKRGVDANQLCRKSSKRINVNSM